VRSVGALFILVYPVPFRLLVQDTLVLLVRPGTEEAVVLALADSANDALATEKADVAADQLAAARQMIASSAGDVVVMFDAGLSPQAQTVIAQFSTVLGGEGRRVLLHPLPLFNNSIGAHDMGLMDGGLTAYDLLAKAGGEVRAMYLAGGFLPEHLRERPDALAKLDFLVVQELFENETTSFADVVFPAASYAEVDGTFTNNDGLVQRVRQSIPPLHQSKADWMIVAQLAKELGMDWGYELSATAVFRDLAKNVAAYSGMTYPLLKDESNPVQAKHELANATPFGQGINALRERVAALDKTGEKIMVTPDVGVELFRLGMLTEKVPQFGLLAAGNPRPETTAVSPLYQITVDRGERVAAKA
jgi:predicted molibdopterin-dependent oxidoreductase YjgC